MISILRKIRISLLSNGAVQKYILYTIGEIALVVIGILLALQINNWNEKRLDRNAWLDYKSRFYLDLKEDTSMIGILMTAINHKVSVLRDISKSISSPLNKEDLPELSGKLLEAERFGWGQFNNSGTTFDDLKNTGNLKLIRNAELRNILTEYYQNWDLQMRRINQRTSRYPEFIYKFVPIEFIQDDIRDLDKQRDIKIETVEHELLTNLLSISGDPAFKLEIQHELNYAKFVYSVLKDVRGHAITILGLME